MGSEVWVDFKSPLKIFIFPDPFPCTSHSCIRPTKRLDQRQGNPRYCDGLIEVITDYAFHTPVNSPHTPTQRDSHPHQLYLYCLRANMSPMHSQMPSCACKDMHPQKGHFHAKCICTLAKTYWHDDPSMIGRSLYKWMHKLCIHRYAVACYALLLMH